MFERLLERLANVSEVEVEQAQPASPVPVYPRPRELTLPLDDVRVGFGTFIGLGRCRLLGEVSARNSSLGACRTFSVKPLH